MDHQPPDSLAGQKDYLRQELLVNGRCDYSRPGSFGLRPVGRRRGSEVEIALAMVAAEAGGLPPGPVRVSGPTEVSRLVQESTQLGFYHGNLKYPVCPGRRSVIGV